MTLQLVHKQMYWIWTSLQRSQALKGNFNILHYTKGSIFYLWGLLVNNVSTECLTHTPSHGWGSKCYELDMFWVIFPGYTPDVCGFFCKTKLVKCFNVYSRT